MGQITCEIVKLIRIGSMIVEFLAAIFIGDQPPIPGTD